jgi:hypothetical protein
MQQPRPVQKRGSGLFKMDLRKMVGINQGRERSDVLLAIMLPAVLMAIAAYTNAWAFLGGNFSFATWEQGINTVEAIIRGLFMEAIVFSSFLLVRILCARGLRGVISSIPPLLVGLVAVTMSAGCGLAWVAKSGQMDWMIKVVALYLPPIAGVFQSGLGLLFPVALAIYALYDVRALIHEHVQRGAELGTLALQVENTEHHQQMLREAQQTANESVKGQYIQLAQTAAQQAVDAAKRGDWSFGLNTTMKTQQLQQTSVTPVSPAAASLQLPQPNAGALPRPPMMPMSPMGQPPINGQFGPAPAAHSGMTQNIQIPPQAPYPPSPYQQR